jgi:3',5'-cyclic AMP phosphodiesterase CpdA
MCRIAHLSDVHILDKNVVSRRDRYRFATKVVSMGRAIDPAARAGRLGRALARAKAGGADHVVISGDLTEVGEPREFERLAEVLHEARMPDGSITLVPGNHDGYTKPNGWAEALAGPLAPFAAASAPANDSHPGPAGRGSAGESRELVRVVERGDVVFLPIDSTQFQSIAWAGGVVTPGTAEALGRRLDDAALRNRALVLVMHHPLFPPAAPWLRWFDGLRGCAEVLELLAQHPRLQLLHGHLHRVVDAILTAGAGETGGQTGQAGKKTGRRYAGKLLRLTRRACGDGPTRSFGAPATCDGPDDASRVRFYEVERGQLREAGAAGQARDG